MRITLFAALFLAGIASGSAQELSVSLHGGVSGLTYKTHMGDGTLGYGGGIGLGYTHYFNNHWGILTGVEARYNSNNFELDDDVQFLSNEIDDQGSAFEYRVSTSGYEEDQKFYSLGIPLMLQYRGIISDKTGFYVGLGGKVLFSQKLDSEASSRSMSLSGYYPDLNLEIDDLPAHGFGTINNWTADSKVSLKTSILLSVEGGLTFKLKENLKLYTGIYADYGLTDMQKDSRVDNIVSYNPQSIEGTTSNGVLATENIVEKSNYLSAGIQLKLGFNLRRQNRVAPTEIVVAPVEPEAPPTEVEQVVEVVEPESPVEPRLTAKEIAFIGEPLVFGEINKSEVPSSMKERLDSIAQLVKGVEGANLKVTGHTCDLGSESLNQRVGMQRAQSVADYLETKGVSRNRMELVSKGESEPVLPNTSVANRKANRRVGVEVVFKD